MNGFFTRIATTEVVLEWCVPNITSADNLKFQKKIGGINLLATQLILQLVEHLVEHIVRT
jgi:hypothetical protein